MLRELQQDLGVVRGLLHYLSHSGQVVQGSGCKTTVLLWRQSLQDEGLTSEMAALPPGHRRGQHWRDSTVRAHREPESKERDVPQGVWNGVIVCRGDEQ